MDNHFKEQLKKELIRTGSNEFKVEDLLSIANHLSSVSKINRSYKFKRNFLDKLENKNPKRSFFPKWIFFPAMVVIVLLFIGTTSIVKAQETIPGDFLYPIKRLSENIVVTFVPNFKAEILQRRSEEIKTLVDKDKSSNLIKSTVVEYNNELEKQKNIAPLKIEESEKNLEEAKERSTGNNKEEINKALINLQNKIENKDESESVKGIQDEKINEKKNNSVENNKQNREDNNSHFKGEKKALNKED